MKFIQTIHTKWYLAKFRQKQMDTRLHKSVSIDLFNLPPLPDEHNTEESYMDVPYNYYVPDGKNSRLLDRTDRVDFDRETLDGNTGFQL